MNNTKEKRMQWHPACFAALNLEFVENKNDLEFLQEQAVNDLPLRIDTLIIKKKRNCRLKNDLGRIFKLYNLVEYKSPDDELSFNTFLKGIAQAYLYKVKFGSIRLENITLTFIRERKPRTLFKQLERYNFVVREKCPGIFYIYGRNIIPIQIIISNRLDRKNHIWLNSLTQKLSMEQAKSLVATTNKLQDVSEKKFADTVWEIVTRANKELIEKMREENIMCKAMAEIFKPEIDAAAKAAAELAFDDKGVQVFKNMITRGYSREEAQVVAEINDELVERALAEC